MSKSITADRSVANEVRAWCAVNGRLEAQRARVSRLKAMMAQLEIDLEYERMELSRLEICTLVDTIDDAFFNN